MSTVLSTYSGKDLVFVATNPLLPQPIQASGVSEKGIAQVIVRKLTDQSVAQVGMDGAVVPSVVPGDMGEFEIQVWQTSTLQQQFIDWYNAIAAARDAGDLSNWWAGTMFVQNIVDGSSQTGTGVAMRKVPDKTYAEQAGRVSWVFVACNLVNM